MTEAERAESVAADEKRAEKTKRRLENKKKREAEKGATSPGG